MFSTSTISELKNNTNDVLLSNLTTFIDNLNVDKRVELKSLHVNIPETRNI